MINFYPGPSKIHNEYKEVVDEIFKSDLVSFNHRSSEFESMYLNSTTKLKEKLEIPSENEVLFLSSATECWETICQSFNHLKCLFIVSGAFSNKWYVQGMNNFKKCQAISLSEEIFLEDLLPEEKFDLICYVHNETSNGYQLREKDQKLLRDKFPEALIAVDATSSLGGVIINFEYSDFLFSSVQKCLGLPPGLAIAITSSKMIKKIEELTKTHHYNHLKNIWENAKKNQTTHTPNTLGIISIGLLFEKLKPISDIAIETRNKAKMMCDFLSENEEYKKFIKKKEYQSETVFCLQNTSIKNILESSQKAGFILGKGYGKLKEDWFRIANFPAHSLTEMEEILTFLKTCK